MAKHGRTVFYEKQTGVVLYDSQEIEVSIDNYAPDYYTLVPKLKEREKESIGEIKFEYGAYAEDFAEGAYIERVELESQTPLFVYPDPNPSPTDPPVPQIALSERLLIAEETVETLKAADLDNKEMIATLYELTLMGGVSNG